MGDGVNHRLGVKRLDKAKTFVKLTTMTAPLIRTKEEFDKIQFVNNATQFTEKYFYSEICSLRQMWGTKSWWQKPEEHREACLKALGFVYCNIVNDDGSQPNSEQIQRWANIFDSTCQEYERRKLYVDLMK